MDDELYLQGLERFHALLRRRDSKEGDWQRLFAACPYILSKALPLQLEPSQIVPLGRPGRSEADFAIQPDPLRPLSPRALIELKRPEQRILTVPRSGVVSLSAAAHTAKRQLEEYAKTYPWRPDSTLILGDEVYKFVIMGLTRSWADLVCKDVENARASGLFGSVRFIAYDQLFESYRQSLPAPRVFLLAPAAGAVSAAGTDGFEELRKRLAQFLMIDNGGHDDGRAWFSHVKLSFFSRDEILRSVLVAAQVPHKFRTIELQGHVTGDVDFDAASIRIYPEPSPREIEDSQHLEDLWNSGYWEVRRRQGD